MKLTEITYLRVIAVVSLVAWHSYCSYVCWGIGESPLDRYYRQIFLLLTPDADMPLFTFISGYLFSHLFAKGKYSDFRSFLKNKVHRLLIPYLILGFIINMTQIGRAHPVELLLGTPNHLWYCLMLFYCFVACWLIEKKCGSRINKIAMWMSFLFVTLVGSRNIVPSPLGIWMPVYYYGYFYCGFQISLYRDKALDFTHRYRYIIMIIFIGTALVPGLKSHLLIPTTISFILLLFTVVSVLSKNIQEVAPPIRLIEKYSFGIYVFHQWIIWNITRYPGMKPFIHEHYILFPLGLFVSVFVFSMLLTHLSIKTKVGRYLLT